MLLFLIISRDIMSLRMVSSDMFLRYYTKKTSVSIPNFSIYMYTNSNNLLTGTGVFARHFHYSLRFQMNKERNKYNYLHQLCSVIYVLQQQRRYLNNRSIFIYTNLSEFQDVYGDVLFSPFVDTLVYETKSLNSSLCFKDLSPLYNKYSIVSRFSDIALSEYSPGIYNKYITLYSGRKFYLTSFFVE